MKPVSHQYEDKLLEFAYGELPAHEASAVESHVKTCARCTSALDQIRTVRNAMSALPEQVPSDKGLDSLMAYAEQAARRNAQAAAPVPFFSKWMKWFAPLAGVTAVLLVGGVYLKANEKVDLTKEHAAAESVKKADDAKAAAPAPAQMAQAIAPDAPKPALKTIDEAEKTADAIPQEAAAPEEKNLADFEAGAKNAAPLRKTGKVAKAPMKELARQRDDKEVALDGIQGNAHAAADQNGKGGGGRVADTGNYYDAKTNGYPRAGLSTGPSSNNTQLGSELSKADTAGSRVSMEKRAAPKERAQAKQEEANDLDNAKVVQKDAPYSAKKAKKGSTAAPSNNVGGGEIVNPTGTYSSSVANKPAETKPEPKKPAPVAEPAPVVADKKAAESDLSVAANEGARGTNQWAGEGAAKSEKKKQSYGLEQQQYRSEPSPQQQVAQAQPPPPPTTQSASPGSGSSMRLAPGLSRGQASTGGEDDSMLNGEVQGPPSSVNTKQIAAGRAARQSQLADLMKQARSANNAGDTRTEVKLVLELLQSDAEGDLRAEGLYRMCHGLQQLGSDDEAQKYCNALAKQFPQSRWAAMSRSEQKNQRSMPAKAPDQRKANSYDEVERPAPAPAQPKSAPADAMQNQAY